MGDDSTEAKTSDTVTVNTHSALFVQLNDVYHIDFPVTPDAPTELVLPRVTTLVRRLRTLVSPAAPEPNVHFCVSGDFLAPSALTRPTKGQHMIEVFNAMGVNFVTPGNHDFEPDLSAEDFYACVERSEFKWVSSNFEVTPTSGLFDRLKDHPRFVPCDLIPLSPRHRILLLGVLGAETFELGEAIDPSAIVEEIIETAEEQLQESNLRDQGFVVVAMTHQDTEQDRALAANCPELRFILGGHDHDEMEGTQSGSCLITKTASNARSVRLGWVVAFAETEVIAAETTQDLPSLGRLLFKEFISPALTAIFLPDAAKLELRKELLARYLLDQGLRDRVQFSRVKGNGEDLFVFSVHLRMDSPAIVDLLSEEPECRRVIDHRLATSGLSLAPIFWTPAALEIRDQAVRTGSTTFGNLIADILRGAPFMAGETFDVALINSGSFRIDRDIPAGGDISLKTLADIFYHENDVVWTELTGAELRLVLQIACNLVRDSHAAGHGNFLQLSGLRAHVTDFALQTVDHQGWVGSLAPLDPGRTYRVATVRYLLENSKPYRALFDGKRINSLGVDIKDHVAQALTQLAHLGEAAAMVLDAEPRWILATRLDDGH